MGATDEIRRRWQKPPGYVAVADEPNELHVINGKAYRGVNFTFDAETIERIKQGYLCVICHEPQSRPFPKTCEAFWCDFPIAEHQLEVFRKTFKGERWIGTTIDWTDELARLDWELDRDNWVDAGNVPGIVVPRKLK